MFLDAPCNIHNSRYLYKNIKLQCISNFKVIKKHNICNKKVYSLWTVFIDFLIYLLKSFLDNYIKLITGLKLRY